MVKRPPDETRPRVLMLTTTLPAEPGDGTPEFVLALASALADDHEVTIVSPRVRGARLDQEIDGVRVKRFRYFPRRWEELADGAILPNLKTSPKLWFQVPTLLISFLWASLREARRSRADVIHAHWLIPAGLVGRIVSAIVRRPFVVTAHGADGYALEAAPFRVLKRRIMRAAAAVSPTSRAMGRQLGMPEDQIARYVAPMGVATEEIARRVGTRQPADKQILFVGRLESKKGVDVLLQAVAQIPGAGVTIIGDGSDRATLEGLARSLDLTDRVRLVGRQPQQRVFEELRIASVLVVPSVVGAGGDRDTTPLVMSEAMSAGVPVIASRLGGLEEQIEDDVNGLLVEPGSVTALRAALERILGDDALAGSLTEAASKSVRASLDISVTSSVYRRIYSEAIAG